MESKRIERSVLCNAEWVQAIGEGRCDVIRKLEQGPCVQYMRDGGWRVGHVVSGLTYWPSSSLSIVRERQTGELLEIPTGKLQAYPQSPIPEPGVEAVQNDEVWHAPDDYPADNRDVMGEDGDGRLFRVWCGPSTHIWYWYGPGNEPPLTRWRELKEWE